MSILLELDDLRQKYNNNIPSDVLSRWIEEKQESYDMRSNEVPDEIDEFRVAHEKEMARLEKKCEQEWEDLKSVHGDSISLQEIARYRESCFKELNKAILELKALRENNPIYGSVLAIERDIEHAEMAAHFDVDHRTGTYDTDQGVQFLHRANAAEMSIKEFKKKVTISDSNPSIGPEH